MAIVVIVYRARSCRSSRIGSRGSAISTAINTIPNPTNTDTVVLIHGLWLNGRSWEHGIER